MATIIQKRRDTAANWTTVDPILALGEEGFETDSLKTKIGDGTTAWTSLPYTLVVADPGTDGTDGTDGLLEDSDKYKLDMVPVSDPSGVTGADQITNMMSLTQTEYDAIITPDASTFYLIVEEE